MVQKVTELASKAIQVPKDMRVKISVNVTTATKLVEAVVAVVRVPKRG